MTTDLIHAAQKKNRELREIIRVPFLITRKAESSSFKAALSTFNRRKKHPKKKEPRKCNAQSGRVNGQKLLETTDSRTRNSKTENTEDQKKNDKTRIERVTSKPLYCWPLRVAFSTLDDTTVGKTTVVSRVRADDTALSVTTCHCSALRRGGRERDSAIPSERHDRGGKTNAGP